MKPRSTYKVITDDVKAIRILRLRRNLSVNKAAVLVGTNKSTLTALENGRINLSQEWIEQILKGYKSNKAAFEAIKNEKLSSKDHLLEEIKMLASKLSTDKLETIIKLLVGMNSIVLIFPSGSLLWI